MLSAGGAEVIDLSEVVAEDGIHRPATDAGILPGDCICAVDGIEIKTIQELNSALDRSCGKEIKLCIRRDGESAEIKICPIKEKSSGKYKIGVLIRIRFPESERLPISRRDRFVSVRWDTVSATEMFLKLQILKCIPAALSELTKGCGERRRTSGAIFER